MLNTLVAAFIGCLEAIISSTGAFGIIFLMTLESCNILIPSEATLTFAGYLASKGEMNFHIASWAGAIGCLIGSFISYYLGYFGGRKFFEKYGKYVLVSKSDLENADKWVDKYGDLAFFLCRMLPIIRTFISLPAGILKARKRIFFTLSFVGSLIWCYGLVFVGYKMGEHLDEVKRIWHKFDQLIFVVFIVLAIIYIYKHIKKFREE
ncbi:DedA family protein [bacterium]|nr:DedA family protein [bacterium]